jgi:hypothetical protein
MPTLYESDPNYRLNDLKMDAAVDDESSQDNERDNGSSNRPPVIFAPPWVGPPAIVAARGAATSVFEA